MIEGILCGRVSSKIATVCPSKGRDLWGVAMPLFGILEKHVCGEAWRSLSPALDSAAHFRAQRVKKIKASFMEGMHTKQSTLPVWS